ncbi:MAG: hypothetical protein E7559_02380 [Ruminococcaceae bacterium]|nr:hypothetical protein [Oscillospiraceae bacterium]
MNNCKTVAEVKETSKKKEYNITAGVLLALCASFMLGIYAPFELYFTNMSDFWFMPKHLLLPVIVSFAAMFVAEVIVFAVARIIHKNVYYFLLAAAFIATIATYIQGTFLVSGIPSMDGTTYDWNQPSPERIKTIVVWAAVTAAVVFVGIKFKYTILEKAVRYISVALMVMLSVSMISIVISSPDEDWSGEYLECTTRNMFEMSDDTNLLVFILDAVDNTTFKNAIESNPEFSNTFDDFTYYNNLLTGYLYTAEAIPFILSGDWDENDQDPITYQNDAFSNSPLIKTLEDEEYSIGLYLCMDNKSKLKKDVFDGRIENYEAVDSVELRFTNLRDSLMVVGGMALVRYAPWDLKRVCYRLPGKIEKSKKLDSRFEYSNSVFYDQIKNNNPIELVDRKCCRIIHIEGAHVPYQYDKNMNWIEDPAQATYSDCVEGCVTMCDKLIQHLKDKGIYDNTAIVIMSDHGYDQVGYRLEGRVNPILLVKGIDEHHEMQYSEAPISHVDCAQGFSELVQGKPSDEIFKYRDGDERERRVLIYDHSKKQECMSEYVTTGRADDFEALTPTGKQYVYGEENTAE